MILPSMTYKEIYDGLVADAKKIEIRIEKMLPKAVRHFKNSLSFPDWYIDEYIIPSTNNQHIIFFYAGNESEIECPHYTIYSIMFNDRQRFVIKGFKMGYRHTPQRNMEELPQIHVYTSHFFQRYNERFLHNDNLTSNEVAGHFFIRNPLPIPINLNEEINRNYKEHGEHNFLGMKVNDGFCFTQSALDGKESEDGIRENDEVESMIVLYTSFMNRANMSATQIKAIEKEHYEVLKRCVDEIENINSLRNN